MTENNPTAAEIQQSLKGVSYPATGAALREHAQAQEADERVMEFLEHIPGDKEYQSPVDLEKDFGKYASDEDNLSEDHLEEAT